MRTVLFILRVWWCVPPPGNTTSPQQKLIVVLETRATLRAQRRLTPTGKVFLFSGYPCLINHLFHQCGWTLSDGGLKRGYVKYFVI